MIVYRDEAPGILKQIDKHIRLEGSHSIWTGYAPSGRPRMRFLGVSVDPRRLAYAARSAGTELVDGAPVVERCTHHNCLTTGHFAVGILKS